MKNIVIAGGGTAGWMAALGIASRLPDTTVSVIDPEVIGPIGVGESVTGVVVAFVNDPNHQLNRREFYRRCDVTFKAGIWYKDWQGVGTDYLSPIDNPPDYFRNYYASYTEEFYAMMAADGAPLEDVVLYGQLMRSSRTDYCRNPDGTIDARQARVSCHFDALKFGAWLRESAVIRPNIRHFDDVIETFRQDPETGNLTHVRTRGGREIQGDFFVDCTGFHRLLLGKAFQPKWKSYSDYIRVDSAIPCFVPLQPDQPLPVYTEAKAMPHGWMWQIPTQSRFGRGYIFSSRYCDDATAIAAMQSAGVDPGASPRILRFQSGRFEQQWIKNVCAIGLSGGFIEPLEASTIHGMYVQVKFLTELYLPFCTNESMPLLAEQYNRLNSIAYDDYVDFISFHYHAGRNDTEFWRDYQKPTAITPTNQYRMEKWKHAFPVREDFAGIYTQRAGHTTGLVLWAPMLAALGQFNREHARRVVEMSEHGQRLRQNVERYIEVRNRILAAALSHAETIQYCQEGL
jgi:tryptophan halogenase